MCCGFLLQCRLYFTTQMNTSDQQKITQLVSLLTGRALTWATAVVERGENVSCYKRFMSVCKQVFNHAPERKEVVERLLGIKQAARHVVEYALDFRTLAAESEWNDLLRASRTYYLSVPCVLHPARQTTTRRGHVEGQIHPGEFFLISVQATIYLYDPSAALRRNVSHSSPDRFWFGGKLHG